MDKNSIKSNTRQQVNKERTTIRNDKNPSGIGKYLVLRFIIVLLFIYVTNNLLELIVQNYYIPFIDNKLYLDEVHFEGSPLLNGIRLLLFLIFSGFITRLPGPARNYLSSVMVKYIGMELTTPIVIANKGALIISLYYLALILSVVLLIVVSLLPYVIGGGWFLFSMRLKIRELVEMDRQKKEDFEKQRNLLLSDIAHDIKTPITAMSGYAKALSDGLVEADKQKEYLDSIYAKSMRVSDLINMLFDYIKLDSAEYKLSMKEEDLAEMVREVVASVYQDFENAGLDVEIDIPEEECMYKMDRLQLSRCVANLLSNALKYTEAGDRVRLKLIPAKNRKNKYILEVADSGLAIDDDFADKIFLPFTREDSVRSTKGGTGLGLSIAHKIVALHNGELILDRNLPDGYTKAFVMYL